MRSNHEHPKGSPWEDWDLVEPTFLRRQHLSPIVAMALTSTHLRWDPMVGVLGPVSLYVWREGVDRLRRESGGGGDSSPLCCALGLLSTY